MPPPKGALPPRPRSALTVAGLDPSGGAGLAADLRGFAAAGVWGCAVCAALTVQSTRGVRAVHPVEPRLLAAQVGELLGDVRVSAVKTGALGSAANIRQMIRLAGVYPSIPLVVDPVMVPSRARGARHRLDGGAGALAAMRALVRRATLVTPNLDEAAALLGAELVTAAEARDAAAAGAGGGAAGGRGGGARAAAAALVRAGARAALVKGGHGSGAESVDWLATPARVVRIAGPRRRGPAIHGTGCALAALIAGHLAARAHRRAPSDDELAAAARWARRRLDAALIQPHRIGNGLAVALVQGGS